MKECLECPVGFKTRYVKNPVIRKNIKACLYGFGVSATTVGVAVHSAGTAAATTAATTGVAAVVGHFTAWPIIGGVAAKYVAGTAAAAGAAAMFPAFLAILPFAIIIWLTVYLSIFLFIRKKTAPYQKGSGLDNLAGVVGKIIFLPLLANYKKLIEENPQCEKQAKEAAIERLHDWGYCNEYAQTLVNEVLKFSSEEIEKNYIAILKKLNTLKKKELFEGIPKYEIPPKGIQKLAEKIAVK